MNTKTTDQNRAKAVDQARLLVTGGMSANEAAAAVAEPLGISGRTVKRWAQQSGESLGVASQDNAKNARVVARSQYLASREELKVRMSKLAHDLIDRCYEKQEDYMSSKDGPERVWYDKPPAADIKGFVTSAAILIDKCRLEEGKATERTERLTVGAIEAWMTEQETAMATDARDTVNAS